MSGVDRAALIEAVAQEIHDELYGCGHRYGAWERRAAARVLDHVLPLIVDALDAMPIAYSCDSGQMMRLEAAAFVRSLMEGDLT